MTKWTFIYQVHTFRVKPFRSIEQINHFVVGHFEVSHTLQSALEIGQGVVSYRLITALSFIGSSIREFSISSVLWVQEVLCFLYSINQSINQSILFRKRGYRDSDISYKNTNYMSKNIYTLIKRNIRDTNNTTLRVFEKH